MVSSIYDSAARAREPSALTVGADCNLWFTNTNGRVGRITVDGVITTHNVARGRGRTPFDVATGPDGNVWFTSLSSNRIGFIRPA